MTAIVQENTISTPTPPQRRYDLDWLRILVFGVLILYHIGMLYTQNWGFHIKSSYLSESLENLMLLVNRWRLPILFLISGIAIRFALNKMSGLKFVGQRSLRLLIPLMFGVLVVVPPQLYFEMTQKGDLALSYWEFYQAFFDLDHPLFENYQSGILPHMDVNHLWYIRELWKFSIVLLIITPLLNARWVQSAVDSLAASGSKTALILVPVVILSILGVSLFPSDSDGYREALGFSFLIFGYLIGWHHQLWELIKATRRVALVIALLSYGLVLFYYHSFWLPGTTDFPWWGKALEALGAYLNRWSWVLAVLGYGATYLNHPGRWRDYFNDAVYPYFILHQSIMIIAAYPLIQLKLGGLTEFAAVLFITIAGCAILFEVIRRVNLLRLLFGLKMLPPRQHCHNQLTTS
ncbi:acyltransferase family protein [Pleionea sp. CnH1-48]|uniref:acyltransferase family protein n=1 Tax=Pleionea sp. CnH1-48 TaxID=2954494 RepID=UPI00209830C0|nr:acyltransferase family protein [Pleionea sp. CnH1-48]MCO7222794.1 acyltransferase family protein [Pleionea sp. CnH1-48]